MKIAIFHNLPSGGAKRYLYEVCSKLKEKHFEIDEYTISTASTYKNLKSFTSNKHVYSYHTKHLLPLEIGRLLYVYRNLHKKIARDIDSQKYDFVLVNHDFLTKSPYILKYLKTKTLYICHEPQREFYEDPKYLAPYIKNRIANFIRLPIKYVDISNGSQAKVIISNSKYSRARLKEVYGNKSIYTVYPGVDRKIFKVSKHVIKKKGTILSIGALNPIKGHDFIIQAIGKLNTKTKLSLTIIGSGTSDEKDKLYKLAAKNKVKMTIKSNTSDQELVKLYRSSHIFAHGAYFEPFGLAALEAISCNTPVIAVNEGGVGEIVKHKINGMLSKRDINEFASHIEKALTTKFGSISQTVADFSWNNCANDIIRISKKL